MPAIKVIVEPCELLEYAEENGIASWNEACDIICELYPSDGAGSQYVEVDYMIKNPQHYDPKLLQIVKGFAEEHDEKFETLSGFYVVPD